MHVPFDAPYWMTLLPIMGFLQAAAIAAPAVGKILGGLFGKKQKKLPAYKPLDYESELPKEFGQLLEQQQTGEMDAINRAGAVSGQRRVGALAARGTYDAPTAASAQGASQAVTAPLLANTLSSRAKKTLTLLDSINRFKQQEHRTQYGAEVAQANQQIQSPWQGAIEGVGDAVGTGLFAKYQDNQRKEWEGKIEGLLGGGQSGTLGDDPNTQAPIGMQQEQMAPDMQLPQNYGQPWTTGMQLPPQYGGGQPGMGMDQWMQNYGQADPSQQGGGGSSLPPPIRP